MSDLIDKMSENIVDKMFEVANLNDLFNYGSGNTYEVAIGKLQDQLKDMERSGTRNSLALMAGMQVMESGIRNDIQRSTYALSNTIQDVGDEIRSDFREGAYALAGTMQGIGAGLSSDIQRSTNNLMCSMQNMAYGIQGSIRESTKTILASQAILGEMFKQGFDSVNNRLNVGFSVLASGMQTLSSDINSLTNGVFAMSEAICSKLDALHDIMNNPLLTASRELYRRAVDEFERGLYEEALESCKQAIEKNKTDFISWYLLGHIYLYGAGKFSNVIDVDQAEISFFNAAKYIDADIGKTEEANKLASEIYYYLGYSRLAKSNNLLVENKQDESKVKMSEAEDASREAWRLSETNLLAAYEQAKELHFLEKDDEALHVLETIIRIEKNFALKASCDKNFESIWNRIDDLIKRLRDEIVLKIKPELDEYGRQCQKLLNIEAWGIKNELAIAEVKRLLPEVNVYETYFSVRDFDESGKVPEIQQKMKEVVALCLDNKYSSGLWSLYKNAKELHASGDEEQALNVLKELICSGWYFAIKASCDVALESIWDKIDELVDNLRDDMVAKIKPEMEEYERQIEMLSNIEGFLRKKLSVLSKLKSLLSYGSVYDNYFSIREFNETKFKEIQQNMDELFRLCLNGQEPNLWIEPYENAQVLYASGNEEQALTILEDLIHDKWYFAVKSRCDQKFEPLWGKIDELVEKLRNELVVKIQPEIEKYELQCKMLSNIEVCRVESLSVLRELKAFPSDGSFFENMDYFSIREFDESYFKDLQKGMNKLITQCLNGKEPNWGEERYKKAQELYASGNAEQALKELEELIREEWYFAVKSRCDKSFENLWGRIDDLIEKLKQETEEKIKTKNEELRTRLTQFRTEFESLNLPTDKEIKTYIKDNYGTVIYPKDGIPSELKRLSSLVQTSIETAEDVFKKDYFSLIIFWEALKKDSQVEGNLSFFNIENLMSNLKSGIEIIKVNKEKEEIEKKKIEKEAEIEKKRKEKEEIIKAQEKHKKKIFNGVIGGTIGFFMFLLAEIIPALLIIASFFEKEEHFYIGSFDLATMSLGSFYFIFIIISSVVCAIFFSLDWNVGYFEGAVSGALGGALGGALVWGAIMVLMAFMSSSRNDISVLVGIIWTIVCIVAISAWIKKYMEEKE